MVAKKQASNIKKSAVINMLAAVLLAGWQLYIIKYSVDSSAVLKFMSYQTKFTRTQLEIMQENIDTIRQKIDAKQELLVYDSTFIDSMASRIADIRNTNFLAVPAPYKRTESEFDEVLENTSLLGTKIISGLQNISQNNIIVNITLTRNNITLDMDSRLGDLAKVDYTQLINLNNFKFFTFNSFCGDKTSPALLIFCPTAPWNFDRRRAIRYTWGSKIYQDKVKVLFALGAVTSPDLQRKIEAENKEFNDILQGNFMDTYRNLTYKTVMCLKYASYYCPQVKYLMKADDDVFINMPQLLRYVEKLDECPPRDMDYIRCFPRSNDIVDRWGKWKVTAEEYASDRYPNFCTGNFPIFFTNDMVFRLYQEAQKMKYFYFEDVYVTGILAEKIHLKHKDYSRYGVYGPSMNELVWSNGEKGPTDFIFSSPSLGTEWIYKLYNFTNARQKDCNMDNIC